MRLLISLVLAAAMLVAGPAAAQAAWAPYENVEHGFSADMPGLPEVSQETIDGVGTATLIGTGGANGFFVVTVMQVPEAMADEPAALDRFLTGVVDGAGGRQTLREATTVSGREARAVAFDLPDAMKADALAVMRGRTVYMALTMRKTSTDPADADRFRRSLRLLD